MSERSQVYKCETGLTVEVLTAASCADLTCCGEPMTEVPAKAEDKGSEKHLPVVEGDEKGVKITVGSIPHPMEEDHFIQWVEVINGDYVNRKYLKPGQEPVAEFYVPKQDGLLVREYCNKHGLWQVE